MFYRLSGTFHTNYQADRKLWKIPADRWQVIVLLVIAVLAPFFVSPLYLGSYVLPWIIWSAAALSLTLLMGMAGQLHFGFAAVMAIGAYSSIHLVRFGVPFEIALFLSGVIAAVIGAIFGSAALRVKGLYLVMATLAMQYLVDWVVVNVPAISGGAHATLRTPAVSFLFMDISSLSSRYWLALGGVSGAILAFCYYRAVTPEQFGFDVSIQLVAMVLVGGLGSVIGSYLGAGFVLLAPIILTNWIAGLAGAGWIPVSQNFLSHLPLVFYGAMIIGFLLFEPLGLAKIYDNIRKYFLVWPFRHARS